MQAENHDFLAILGILTDRDVEFVVVGALSAVLQGAPIMTFDLDVVHRRSDENVEALLGALDVLDARYRGRGDQILVPTAEHLKGPGHQLLITRHGPLDLLGAIEDDLDYEDLIDDALKMSADDIEFSVLPLERYVALKEKSERSQDLARLPILRETLAEKEKNDNGDS